jgi:methylglutaconyl-CoA hydratase
MTDSTEMLTQERDERGVCTVTLNRPALHNAFDDALIAALTDTFRALGADPAVRVVILAGAGKSFSAGADLGWMKRMAAYSREDNQTDALALAEMVHAIATCSKPVIARVQGAAFGGGVGLVAACDMAVGGPKASFCLSEVKLGLIPAAISPYVIEAIGARAAKRYFLTAERFDAQEALRLGLLHQACADDAAMDAAIAGLVEALLVAGPNALRASKELIEAVAHRPITADLRADTAARIAEIRVSAEGQEGLKAFFDKRTPAWISSPSKD